MFFSEKLLLKRVLIANRGEIACRIHRSWIKLKIEPVGVYSKADEKALHVSLVDQFVELTSKDALSISMLIFSLQQQVDQNVMQFIQDMDFYRKTWNLLKSVNKRI